MHNEKIMYTFSNRLKIGSIVLMVVGLLGVGYGFLSVPGTVEEAKAMVEDHSGEEAEEHAYRSYEGGEELAMSAKPNADSSESFAGDSEAGSIIVQEQSVEDQEHSEAAGEHSESAGEHSGEHGAEHDEHLLHQLQTKPWSAIFVAAFFFLMLALGALVFYAIQYAASAGWSPVLYRVIEGITAYVLPGSIIVFLIVVFAGEHFYPWQDEELVAGDKVLQGKEGYLNFPFFVIRALIYIAVWNVYRYFSRRNSLRQAEARDNKHYKQNFKFAVIFLLCFLTTEATMAVDWFMSLTPHWYSTLLPWYVFATMFVSAITTIAMVTVFLKSKGLLPFVNDSHVHDLAKFMFGFSIFWTYLWFGQFMLIWYANIPEEVTYFIIRIQEYNLLFFGMLVLNFVFPILLLMNSDFKRIPWFVIMTGTVILIGHYLDVFQLVMGSTVGPYWSFGFAEIGAVLFFLGLFVITVGTALSKVSLRPLRDPYIKESENYHY